VSYDETNVKNAGKNKEFKNEESQIDKKIV
jgi:hypothetical protein